jgi:hypothetical protein
MVLDQFPIILAASGKWGIPRRISGDFRPCGGATGIRRSPSM